MPCRVGHRRLGDLADEPLGAQAVAPELGDRDHRQPMRAGERLELAAAAPSRVRSGVTTSERTPAGWSPASRARSTAASVWPGRSSTPPGRLRSGKMWPGRTKSAGDGVRIGERAERPRAVGGRDARRDARGEVDRDRERGALPLSVVADHQRQVELVEPLAWESAAQMTPEVCSRKNASDSRRDRVGGHDEVALVLAVLVVGDDDHLAATDRGDGLRSECGHPPDSPPLIGVQPGLRVRRRPRRPSLGRTCSPKRSISRRGSSRQTIRPSRPSMSS